MHDEFRVEVEVPRERAHALLGALGSLQRGVSGEVPSPKHVAVSHEDGHVFMYADSAEDATGASAALGATLAKLGIDVTPVTRRWHPEEERWEDISAPLPSTPAGHVADRRSTGSPIGQHARLEQNETAGSDAAGHPEWEVRVSLPTHHDARDFAERLESEGYPLRRHWRHLQLGARDEDDARALGERLRVEAPEGSEIEVEGDAADAWAEVTAPSRPFAIFGGLAQ